MNNNSLLLPTLMLGVFALLTMELGAMGIIPIIAEVYGVSVADAGWVVSVFALIVAFAAPILPLLVAKYDAKKVILLCLFVFSLTSLLAAFVSDFIVLLILRAIPAFFHPIYCAFAFSLAADSVSQSEAPKAVAKVFIAVSAGMTLGVPLTSFIASQFSLEVAFLFFALINTLAFLATLFFIPTQNKPKNVSHKEQFGVLLKPVVWASVLVVIALNGAMFGFYSYMSEFLLTFTQVSFKAISALLLVYGLSNVIGNIIAGKTLTSHPKATLQSVPLVLIALYVGLFFGGENIMLTCGILLILGIFAGIGNNIAQYSITSPIPEAKELANGIFIGAANIGVTFGTALCGLFISLEGSRFAVLAAVLLMCLAVFLLLVREKLLQS